MLLNSRNNVLLLAALALSSVAGTSAFIKPSPNAVSKVNTEINSSSSSAPEPSFPFTEAIYGEGSRKFRRTVYTHDDWKKHRSPDRFIRNLKSFTSSGVYTNIGREVTTATSIAAFVVLWNAITGGYTDLEGSKHAALFANTFIGPLSLSLAPFTLSSPSLGLLLGMFSSDLFIFLIWFW